MPRAAPTGRFEDLIEAAQRAFIAHGYRRTQMADVAAEMGVAKGTVYLYVESKAALFEAALRYADEKPPPIEELALPVRCPPEGSLQSTLRTRLAREAGPPELLRALERTRARDVRRELEGIVRELFALSSRYRTAIKLIDRCGRDHPELARIFYDHGRYAQLEMLERYLDSRIRSGQLRSVPDPLLAARFVIEAIATWAVHIHWDPAPQPISPVDAEETVVALVTGGLLAA